MFKRYAVSWAGGPPSGGFATADTLREAIAFARNNKGHLDGPVLLLGTIGRGAYSDRAISAYARKRFAAALRP